MKKLFLTLTMLLFAFTGVMRAQTLTVHDGTATNGYVPVYGFYADAYNKCEMVYPEAELSAMSGAMINSMTFEASEASVNWGSATFQVFLAEAADATISAFAGPGTIVYEGALSIVNNEMVVTFDAPYTYNGGNLLVGFYQTAKGSYVTSTWKGESVTGASVQGYSYSSLTDCSASQRNFLPKVTFEYVVGGAATVTTDPTPLDLGYRPNGYWMAPYTFDIVNNGGAISVTEFSFNDNYFTANAELPAAVYSGNPLTVEVTTGETENVGPINTEMLVLFDGGRNFETFPITATAYDPVDGDVWEKAIEVPTLDPRTPYESELPEMLYKNYELPDGNINTDAVYQVTFDEDVLLYAGTNSANGSTFLYNENFEEVGGPAEDNNYEYNGPTINPGPTALWWSYNYTGTNTWYGTSAGGGYYFGYKISTDVIAENELAGLTITTVETAAREAYPYECYIIEGGSTPFDGDLIGYGVIENPDALYFFDIDLEEPAYISGNQDIWVIFYSDSPYAAYCGRTPVDTNNGKIWTYNPNATSPMWSSNVSYTPVIYARMLELPTGREVNMNLASMEIKQGNGTISEDATAEGNVMNVANASLRNRANETLTVYEPWTCPFNCQIDGMYVPAGTYYLVFASDVARDVVDIAIDEVPVPDQAFVIAPYNGEQNVVAPYLAEWVLGDYTAEMQVLCGTQYPPTTVLIDWTDYLVPSTFLTELEGNKNYFIQVNARNAAGTTMGEIVGFTTPIDPVEGFTVAEANLYPGDAAEFSWDANERTLMGYNIYKDGVLVNVEGPITGTEYSVEGLEYNMAGYEFTIKAVYAAGESMPSEPINVKMTGTATVSGHVYDLDVDHPVANVPVSLLVLDEYGQDQAFEAMTDENGFYTAEILAGPLCMVGVSDVNGEAFGYGAAVYFDPATGLPYFAVDYQGVYENIDIITHEYYYPLGMITATEQTEDNNVLVEWDWAPAEMIVDFETGDFSQAEFTLPATYPWTVTTTNPYEGTYCMKSTCEGVASGISSIEATVEVPYDAKMGFWVRVSSESNYDKFHFYIDGVEQGSALSGQLAYQYKEYAVEAGTHTYKWEYGKDSSVNSNDDCVYVDNITMYRQDIPAPPIPGATVYDFENGMQGWTSLDANNDGYGWVLGSEIGGVYLVSGASLAGTGHESSNDMVCSGSYSNATSSAITPDNYLVSPTQISAEDGAQIRFYACAQDASYAAEHFGVAVSTTTATASAFTTVQEWTLTAKSVRTFEEATRGNRDQGSWYEYTVDLSAYAGQDIWVAIRHFNCNDQFILNVDDITLADGSAKPMVRNDRTFQGFNLYRRDIKNVVDPDDAEPVLIATPASDVFEYIDNAWSSLEYGMYQWGIAATYDGYAPVANRDEFTYTFDSGLEGWTNIDGDGDGNVWFNSSESQTYSCYSYATYGHNATGCFMVSQSYTDCTYDAYDADNYLVSPQKYAIDASSSITFWKDYANDTYPDHLEVMVSTADNPGASDFTSIWSRGSKSQGTGAEIRNVNNRYENWTEYTVSLAAYAGQEVWIAFHHEDYDNYEIWLDDVTITAGSSTPTPTPPLPVPTATGESEILWSNVIDKDMISNVTVNVALNNNQEPVGAEVTFAGIETYVATVDETGSVNIPNFRKGNYNLTVTLDGYNNYDETVSITEATRVFDVTLYEQILPVEGLYVSPTGWAKWDGGASGGTTPIGPVGPTTTWTDDFEDGNLTNWTLIDADGDGDSWNAATPAAYGIGNAHSGTYCASSWSWNSVAFDPDQYMISPLSEGAISINYFVATNTAYADHYGIVASSTGTNASDFTVVFEETAGSKGGNGNGGAKTSMTLNGGTREMSDWIEKTVELPAGTKYVGFRHWNSSDMNYLFIDDVTITMGGAKGDRAALSYKVKLDGEYEGETPNTYFQHNVEGFEAGSEHITEVAAVYATGMGDWVAYNWIYTPCSEYNGVTNYAAAVEGNNVNLSWTLNGTPGPGPVTPPTTETFNFDDGTMQGWTSIDADNDGYGWVTGSNIGGVYLVAGASLAGSGHNSSADLVCSGSYSNVVGALTPNNYLVAPAKGAYQNVSFYACGQDAGYVAEHFGVAVATVDNPTAADFTIVNEWTMTAKSSGVKSIGRNGESKDQGSWHQFTADLSAYAGQEVWVAIRHFNCTDMFILDVDDITLGAGTKGNRNRTMWDLVYEFDATSGYQYGVASDGQNIYTSSWSASSTSMFYKYDMQGNFIEEFNITGCGQCRGLTYDGQYFYGVANAATIYCVDLANHALIGTTSTSYGAMRCITYDPERDGFWVVGNWSGNLTLLDRTGAVVQAGPAPTSASDVAYYKDPDGVEHVYCLNNGTNDVDDYNITTNTMSSAVFNLNTNPVITGSTGGCFVGAYDGKTCLFADIQQSPQHIAIYELDGSGTGPTPPPTPVPGDVLGVYVFRDGELISADPVTTGTFTDSNVEAGEHEYCVRVVYSDYAMSCPQCETVNVEGVTCDPVTNLTATQTEDPNYGMGILLEWEGNANSYKVYQGAELLGSIAGTSAFIYNIGDGEYTFGVVAVYTNPACESEMVTVTIVYDAIEENEIVNNLYPNPTSDKVTIEAQGMNHITVVTTLGQVVYDADVDADMIELNLGQYNAGLYLVRVSTVNGVSVKRVTVVK